MHHIPNRYNVTYNVLCLHVLDVAGLHNSFKFTI